MAQFPPQQRHVGKTPRNSSLRNSSSIKSGISLYSSKTVFFYKIFQKFVVFGHFGPWKRVALGISWRSNNMHYKINCEMSFPFVSGHSHWMLDMRQGGGQQEKLSQIILSFDVNNEKFREQPLPDDGSFSGHSVELIA